LKVHRHRLKRRSEDSQTCPWRIPNESQNNGLRSLIVFRDARCYRPSGSRDRHCAPYYEGGGLGGVLAESVLVKHQLLILNRGRKRAKSQSFGSYRCGLYSVHAPPTDSSVGYRREAIHFVKSARRADRTKVSAVVLAANWSPSGPERTDQRTHRCHRGDETAESDLGLSAYRSANWHRRLALKSTRTLRAES